MTGEKWWAEGLIFENCNCELLCRAHLSYKRPCDYERCIGHWAIRFDDGRYGDIPLGALNVFIVIETPQIMLDGDWTQVICIDERADGPQREAIETILTGGAGGTWTILAGLVGRRLETRFLPIQFRDEGRKLSVWVEGGFHSSVEAIMGQDKSEDVRLVNAHNQIHGRDQIVARGTTRFEDQGLVLITEGSHAITSRFSWSGP